jgi:hypothetical protein
MNKKFLIAIVVVMALPLIARRQVDEAKDETMSKYNDRLLGNNEAYYDLNVSEQSKGRKMFPSESLDAPFHTMDDFLAVYNKRALDSYLSNFSFYAKNRRVYTNKTDKVQKDGLIKLIRATEGLFSSSAMAETQLRENYSKYLTLVPIKHLIANLYDIVVRAAKISKHKSIELYGMYRTKPWFKGYNEKFYLPNEKTPFFEQPEKFAWSLRNTAIAAAAVTGAAYLAWRNREAIENKASDIYAQSPMLQNAYGSVKPYTDKFGEYTGSAVEGAKGYGKQFGNYVSSKAGAAAEGARYYAAVGRGYANSWWNRARGKEQAYLLDEQTMADQQVRERDRAVAERDEANLLEQKISVRNASDNERAAANRVRLDKANLWEQKRMYKNALNKEEAALASKASDLKREYNKTVKEEKSVKGMKKREPRVRAPRKTTVVESRQKPRQHSYAAGKESSEATFKATRERGKNARESRSQHQRDVSGSRPTFWK